MLMILNDYVTLWYYRVGLINGLEKWLDEVRKQNISHFLSTTKTVDFLPEITVLRYPKKFAECIRYAPIFKSENSATVTW